MYWICLHLTWRKTSEFHVVCEMQSYFKYDSPQTTLSQLSDDKKVAVDEVSGKYYTSVLLSCLTNRCLKWKADSFYAMI